MVKRLKRLNRYWRRIKADVYGATLAVLLVLVGLVVAVYEA